MEHLYNPDQMSEQEIKQTFVARQGLMDELVSLIERQPDGAGVQHVVIIAPRGMGKTTILLMLQFAIKDRGLASAWQAVRFPEESYGIADLADFWLQALDLLAQDTDDNALRLETTRIRQEYQNSNDLQSAALALIKDWRRQHNKRLVLLVDNFDIILDQINNEQDNASLRNVLMNDGDMMLIGGATSFFREARSYDQPLYNFFKIFDLSKLTFTEMEELLRQRAALDGNTNFEKTLQRNSSRLRVLEYFTDGNPRLMLMLYRVIAKSEVLEVRQGLEELLDQVTPYYKAKIESLPAQQRKILDHIARVSGQTHEGLMPTDIGKATRLTTNAVSSQLKRLSDLGYVRAANVRGRSSYYTLSDPLYALWHQMRFSRDVHQRMRWLVDFLKSWYDISELTIASKQLRTRFQESHQAGHIQEAQNALVNRAYLLEAIGGSMLRNAEAESVIAACIESDNTEALQNHILPMLDLDTVSSRVLDSLLKAECITEREYDKRKSYLREKQEIVDQIMRGSEVLITLFNDPTNHKAFLIRSAILVGCGDYENAMRVLNDPHAAQLRTPLSWILRAIALIGLLRSDEALEAIDEALKLYPQEYAVWWIHAALLAEFDRPDQARVSLDRGLAILSKSSDCSTYVFSMQVMYFLFEVEVSNGDFTRAKAKWNEIVNDKILINGHESALLQALMGATLTGYSAFVRQLITESDMEGAFFPLARAIDFLSTGERALIEKLSPEMKNIVEDMVERLRTAKIQAKVRPPLLRVESSG